MDLHDWVSKLEGVRASEKADAAVIDDRRARARQNYEAELAIIEGMELDFLRVVNRHWSEEEIKKAKGL